MMLQLGYSVVLMFVLQFVLEVLVYKDGLFAYTTWLHGV